MKLDIDAFIAINMIKNTKLLPWSIYTLHEQIISHSTIVIKNTAQLC